jgi:hypothetical protein
MNEKPRSVYVLIVLWLLLSVIFIAWTSFSLSLVLSIPSWESEIPSLSPMLYFGSLVSTITWMVFALLFFVFSYGTFKGKSWVWTTGIIFSTIFIVIFGLMLASFMVTTILFPSFFTILGLETVVLSFIIDLGIIYYLTRPAVKVHFNLSEDSNINII